MKSSTFNDDVKFDSRKENEALNMFKSFLKTTDKHTHKSNDNERIRMLALQKTKSIIKLLKTSNDRNRLTGIFDGLKNTYLIGCSLKKNENSKKVMVKKQKFASNQLFKLQSFVSTKKKKKKPRKKSKFKVSTLEKYELKEFETKIAHSLPSVCAMCFQTIDKNGESKFFKCMSCECSIHNSCNLHVGVDEKNLFLCSSCR